MITQISTIYTDAGLPDARAADFAGNAINLVFIVAGILALYFLVTAGFKYVTSGGNPENAKKAGQTIIFASLGLFLILISVTLINWVFKVGS